GGARMIPTGASPNALVVAGNLALRMSLGEALGAAGFQPILCGTAGFARETLGEEPVAVALVDAALDGEVAELRDDPIAAGLPFLVIDCSEPVEQIAARAKQLLEDRFPVRPAGEGIRASMTVEKSGAAVLVI